MKKIIFVRHAKSSWEFNVGDIDRPLKNVGITDANTISNQFKDNVLKIDFVASSPANRALSTCNIFVKSLGLNIENLEISNKLYDFGGNNVIDYIKSLDNNYNNIMIFGHNHAFTSIVNSSGSQYIDNVPTCGLVVIEFNIDKWSDLKTGKTILTLFPKQFRN